MDDKYTPNGMPEKDQREHTGADQEASEHSDSLYSYNYRNREESKTTHEGDYYESKPAEDRTVHVHSQNPDDAEGSLGSFQTDQSQGQNQNSTFQQNHEPFQEKMSYKKPTVEAAQKTESFSHGGTGRDGDTSRGNRKHTAAGKKKGQSFFKRKNFGTTVIKCAVLAVVFGLVAGGVFTGITYIGSARGGAENSVTANSERTTDGNEVETTPVGKTDTVNDVSQIVKNVMPSIVSITNIGQSEYYNMFGQSQSYSSESRGSGIIFGEDDTNLYIATNNHVVSGATSLTVCFSDDKTASGTIKGTDPSSDLAVVQVPKNTLEKDTLATIKVATLGKSADLTVGQSAIAIGNALGYGQSVTTGVISALDRQVTTQDAQTGEAYTNKLVQTDAAINPGNSGGALLNMNGEVIGINSVKYSDTDVEGMGYAIPIDTAQPILEDLITREKVDASKGAYLGIQGVDVTDEVASTYQMPEGVYLIQVTEGGAAAKAGLMSGDIITAFDGHKITSMESLKSQLEYYEAGTKVPVTIQRAANGKYVEKEVSVTLGKKNN